MATYEKEDCVFGDFDFDNFSNFSDISDDDHDAELSNITLSGDEEDDGRNYCTYERMISKEMIARKMPGGVVPH